MGIFVPWVLLVPLAAALAIWLGEDLHRARLPTFTVLALLLACVGGLPAQRFGIRPMVMTVVISVFVVVAGYLFGALAGRAAFQECERNADDVRRLLEDFRREHGDYPQDLLELPLASLPGARMLRKSVLRYERRNGGYLLSYSDWAAEHRATEKDHWVTLLAD